MLGQPQNALLIEGIGVVQGQQASQHGVDGRQDKAADDGWKDPLQPKAWQQGRGDQQSQPVDKEADDQGGDQPEGARHPQDDGADEEVDQAQRQGRGQGSQPSRPPWLGNKGHAWQQGRCDDQGNGVYEPDQ
ncbi:MAG: hypothetical protein V9H69_08285 [Anaerolineae bacterium]